MIPFIPCKLFPSCFCNITLGFLGEEEQRAISDEFGRNRRTPTIQCQQSTTLSVENKVYLLFLSFIVMSGQLFLDKDISEW